MSQKSCQVYLWRCSFCGKKAYGKKPPISCNKCFSEANRYILIPKKEADIEVPNLEKFFGMPGLNNFLYLVGSTLDGRPNAMCCSSVTQISFCPARVAVAVNKNNLTHDFIKESGVFSLSPLTQSQGKVAHFFGRNSGRQVNKFEQYHYRSAVTGSPIIEGSFGYYDCEVEHRATVELDSHTLFVGKIIDGSLNSNELFLTYYDYKREYLAPRHNIT
ncbi:flavin reductase domain protein, FMN-binding protein [Desulforamulus reducens MI-1]|uniref:Flavin reductase domain protein, FMN-binding protein n=1 Tax=Desulforamulus reducens (strain ATCC BAA-1160 / DSM 100696 / MI-1) TaxID=349161 RepID=A4J3Y6_DESRM|nr:flavin reductase family protein [Desulforamulus reducens]ABO49789.1 flavin reductase domain protein, FMN-binding protein [Desulforamulus reducens MI-1]